MLLTRVDANASYVTDVLPGVIVFGLGLSATVAPLTATALNSVAENRVGVASGINNAVSRIAGVLAIAIFGALIAGKFGSTVDGKVGELQPFRRRPTTRSARRRTTRSQQPSTDRLPPAEAAEVESATVAGAEDGFHLAMMSAGTLMIVGGVIAGIGLRNPPAGDGVRWAARSPSRGVRPLPRPPRRTGQIEIEPEPVADPA